MSVCVVDLLILRGLMGEPSPSCASSQGVYYVSHMESYVGHIESYVGHIESYVGHIESYVGHIESYVGHI
jgi:hypothetical protein